ncbi:MAG: hypothetical protein QM813_24375 [Verrucomicrobiota bacterium]
MVQIALTFVLIDFAWLFFRAPSLGVAMDMILYTFRAAGQGAIWPWVLAGGNVVAFGSMALLLLVDVIHNTGHAIRPHVVRLPLPVRWAAYLVFVYTLLLFGVYGPGFAQSQFIYFQF